MKVSKVIEEKLKKHHYFNYPQLYKEKITEVLNYSLEVFKDNLCSITLGGSGGKNKLMPGWSDLDFYIVLYNYDYRQVRDFMKIDINSDIHIGTTFYTKEEVLNNIIDNKTKIMIYEKFHLGANPTLYGETCFLKNDYQEVKKNDLRAFPNILHLFRRGFIELEYGIIELDKKYVKKMVLLLKCILNHFNIFALGYEDAFDKFKVLYKEETKGKEVGNLDIKKIIKDLQGSKKEVLSFSKCLLEFAITNQILKGGKRDETN